MFKTIVCFFLSCPAQVSTLSFTDSDITLTFPAGSYDYTPSPGTEEINVSCTAGGGNGSDSSDLAGVRGAYMSATFHAPHAPVRVKVGFGGHDGISGGNTSFGDLLVVYGGGSQPGHGSPGGDGFCTVRELKGNGER